MAHSNPHIEPGAYTGRFAPSPTGPLHFGSLIAALASFLDARANQGVWLVRMEDLDPPREPEGAAQQILDQLQHLQLHWDGEVLYQSQRHAAYEAAISKLAKQQLCYECSCTRQDIREMGLVYDGRCRNTSHPHDTQTALRVVTNNNPCQIDDLIQGNVCQNVQQEVGDFVIQRKDGLFAYQLAVVVDDAYQGITHIVRGYDLIDSTPRQLYLQQIMGYPTPSYAHIPVIVNAEGQKLSKQRFATAIDTDMGAKLILEALKFLGQQPPESLLGATISDLLEWGIAHWDIQSVPKLANIPELTI